MRATNKVIQRNKNTGKIENRMCKLQSSEQKTNFKHVTYNFPPNMGKPHSQNKFFHKIWLKIGDCKYNQIAEIEIVKKGEKMVAFLWGKQIVSSARKMQYFLLQNGKVKKSVKGGRKELRVCHLTTLKVLRLWE